MLLVFSHVIVFLDHIAAYLVQKLSIYYPFLLELKYLFISGNTFSTSEIPFPEL